LWRPSSWQPSLTFIDKHPVTPKEKIKAQSELEAFYHGYERFVNSPELTNKKNFDRVYEISARLVDAMTDIERNRIPFLSYSKPAVSNSRLEVELEGADGAEIGQLRIISDQGKRVFKGEIESIRGSQCTLVSKSHFISEERIPRKGSLEIDWNMARVAINRQRNALEKFKSLGLVNPRLSKYVTQSVLGSDDLNFASNVKYFNADLDNEKKALVSRFVAMDDILLIHGPPGTGKTTLIVEMIRQFLSRDSARRILLVAQTHVALDHALTGVLKEDPSIKLVRIGSGTRELEESVRFCSVEERGKMLQRNVKIQAREYVKREAAKLNVDINEIQLGID
ncbi:AAA family ATPase, partial [bacterium]|nr:AAA family ATPase [bacterium]